MSEEEVVVSVCSYESFIQDLEFPLAIDSYQRPYVWTEEKVEELIEDLRLYLEDTKGLSYYMGTLLLHEGIDSKDGKTKLFIIDGQQRLTSLSVLYYVLYGNFTNESKIGLSYNSPISVRQIYSAKKVFEKEQYLVFFSDLKETLFKNIHFTVIKTYSEDLAFTFFDTQNNRGVKLKSTDLLKAYHLRAINSSDKRLQVHCAQKWEEVQTCKPIFKAQEDFVSELFDKFIWRSRTWKGQNDLNRENDDAILESFQKPTLDMGESKRVPLFANVNNQLANALEVDGNNHFRLNTKGVSLTADSAYLPFTLRQPISKGLGFFLFTEKYAHLMQKLLRDELYEVDFEIKAFRHFYEAVFDHMSIYLKELFLLGVMVFFDKFGSSRLLEFSLWLDHLLGAIRLEKHYIFWQAPIKFLKENPQNLIDVISTSFITDEPIEFMKILAKNNKAYENEIIEIGKGVKGHYKEALMRYYNKAIPEDKDESNHLIDKRDWINTEFIKEKLCQK